MNIKYKDSKTKKKCTDRKQATKDLGKYGDELIAKINLIDSMVNFSDVLNYPSFHAHKLEGDKKNYWSLDVKGRKCSWRIIVAPLDEEENIVVPNNEFFKVCQALKVILIEEVSKHYE